MAKDDIAKSQLKAQAAKQEAAQKRLDADLDRLEKDQKALDEQVKGKWADLSAAQDKLQAGQDRLEKDGKDLVEAKRALDEEKTDMGVRAEAMAPRPARIDPKANDRLSAAEEGELATLEAQAKNGVRTPSPPDMFRLAALRIRSELE